MPTRHSLSNMVSASVRFHTYSGSLYPNIVSKMFEIAFHCSLVIVDSPPSFGVATVSVVSIVSIGVGLVDVLA